MCYNVRFLTKKRLNYLKRLGQLAGESEDLERELGEIEQIIEPTFHTIAFSHPIVPVVFKSDEKLQVVPMRWGLIPDWVNTLEKAKQMENSTLNARVESIMLKPAFKNASIKNRCVILLDGYFEYRVQPKGKIAHHIISPSDEPLFVAGIYTQPNQVYNVNNFATFSLLTNEPTPFISKYLFNDASDGRMPLIMNSPSADLWLSTANTSNEMLDKVAKDAKEIELHAYSVSPLSGKLSVGNNEEAIRPINYPTTLNNQLSFDF